MDVKEILSLIESIKSDNSLSPQQKIDEFFSIKEDSEHPIHYVARFNSFAGVLGSTIFLIPTYLFRDSLKYIFVLNPYLRQKTSKDTLSR